MPKYSHRYEVKPGRFVYVPTDETRKEGQGILAEILEQWSPGHVFYHLLRNGGHVVAARRHKGHHFFGKRDIDHFFSRATKTKVGRALRDVGFDNRRAFDIATASVVVDSAGRKHVPYGFIQSPLLATLALEKSALGRFLLRPPPVGLTVTVYVDDIAFSADDPGLVKAYGADLDAVSEVAGFPFAASKIVECATGIELFNCHIDEETMVVTPDRMEEFHSTAMSGSDACYEGIVRYIKAINESQAVEFVRLFAESKI